MPFHRLLKKTNKRKRRNSSDTGKPQLLTSPKTPSFARMFCERAVLCTFRQASLTVEASVVLPLFLIGMIMMIGIMDVCRIQTEENADLAEKAKNLSMYAYGIGDRMGEDVIDLCQVKTCELPVNLFPFSGIPIVVRARVHTWTGRSDRDTFPGGDGSSAAETLVYVTENGEVYHTSASCTYLDLSIYSADVSELGSLRNEYGSRYHACEKCRNNASGSGQIFLTGKGEKYHTSLSCSGLTRTTKMVKLSEVDGSHICSRCNGG